MVHRRTGKEVVIDLAFKFSANSPKCSGFIHYFPRKSV